MTPRFSIIIPVYNVAPYLRECLDSVLAQVYTDWEAICVDDGSTDGSGAILDEYAAKDGRFRALHQANAGVGLTRNVAMDLAVGEWLCFVDADDAVASNWLEVLNSGASIEGVDWVRIGCGVWNGAALPKTCEYTGVPVPCFSDFDKWEAISETTLMQSNAYRRAIIQHAFDTQLKVCEDSVFEMTALRSVRGLCKLNWSGYYYRARQGSASHVVYGVSMSERYFSSVLGIVSQMNRDEIDQVAKPLTERLRKDVSFLMTHLIADVSRDEFSCVRELLKRLIEIGAINYRYLRPHGDGLRWHLYFLTGCVVFLRTTGGVAGLVKIVPYLFSRDIRWLTDFKAKVKELFVGSR